jgi:hypothetical protein
MHPPRHGHQRGIAGTMRIGDPGFSRVLVLELAEPGPQKPLAQTDRPPATDSAPERPDASADRVTTAEPS